jgi:hypothetical protein
MSGCLTWFVYQRAPAIIDARRRRLAIIENFYSEIDRPETSGSAVDLPVGADGALSQFRGRPDQEKYQQPAICADL